MMSATRSSHFLFGATCAFFLAAANLFAGTLNSNQLPSISVKIASDTAPNTWTLDATTADYKPATNADGGWELSSTKGGPGALGGRANIYVDLLQFDPDPFVLNNVLVTNTTTTTQLYTATVGLPTGFFAAPNQIRGTVRTSVIDGGSDGATIATSNPTALYQAQIDGGTVQTLQNHAFSVVAPAGDQNTSSASFGFQPSAIPVNTSIGIQLNFTLTPGDTAAILSRFDVIAIPEPTALMLSGCAVAMLLSTRGRRR